MLLTVKTKIWLTILSIVLMFTFFTLYYFPHQQGQQLMKIYNKEVQNLANTVALGVEIAITEEHFEGVRKSMEYLKNDPRMKSVTMLLTDTLWNDEHTTYKTKLQVFKTFPESVIVNDVSPKSNDSMLYKKAAFETPAMSGKILLAYYTTEIDKSKRKIRVASLLVSGLVLGLGILLGFWLSRKISVPVLALRDAAFRVGEGDFSRRIEKFSNDEIGELGMAFNKMTDQLFQSRKTLNEANQSLSESNESLNKTLLELKSTQNQLIQSEKMASLGELTAGIAHEIQNPLNFVINFSEVSAELVDELKKDIFTASTDELLSKSEDLDQNLQKIIHHGKRADSIVKSMLQHTRTSSGISEPTDINALLDEYLRLSYHGLRAKDKSFSANFETNLDSNLPRIKVTSRDIGRVFLNIFNNAFYSVGVKRSYSHDYTAMVTVSTKLLGDMAEIRIRDNGLGIPGKALDKIFQPFFTTKPTGQGTGLGLSLSYDIIKAHNGLLFVETVEGEFAEFIIHLPLNPTG